jgi:prepilin-type N-terminal cleavage/methylation domain-containing protein
MKAPSLTPRRAGFTLIELLVVVTIIALLFAMVVGGFSFADRFSKTSSTERTIKAIGIGLENYKRDFGEYPEPASPNDTTSIANKSYVVSGAAMLYQALSGDGHDQILLRQAPRSLPTSDGNIDEDESGSVKFANMPKELWTNQDNRYYMVDGFGKPYQYVKAASVDPTRPDIAPPVITINSTYDLWSYGADEENITARSIETTTDESLKDATSKWIKNW